jgi:hypothetical protein
MAGTIIADTLTHSTAGSVTTDYVVNGSAKAWVNFNGTGTVAIRDDLNVSTISDNGTGDYTVNFTNNMANANYAAAAIANGSGTANAAPNLDGAITSSTIPIRTQSTTFDDQRDTDYVLVSSHGDLA